MQRFKTLLFTSMLLFATSLHATTLTIWHPRHEANQYWSQLIQEFQQQYPGIRLKVLYLPTEELKIALIRSAYHGNAPDLVLSPSDFIGNHKKMKLSVVPPEDINPNQQPKYLKTTQLDGTNYGIPLVAGNHLLLYYNKKYIKHPATTWKQLYQQHAELAQQDIKTIALKYNEMYWFSSFITAFGGFPVEGNKLTLNTQAVADALIFYKGLSELQLVPADCDYNCVTERFYQQEFAYSINGDWAYKEAADKLGEDFGATSIPNIDDSMVRPMYSSLSLIFPNDSLQGEKSKEIRLLAQFLQTPHQQLNLYEASGLMPTHSQVLQILESRTDDNRQAALKQLSNAVAMPPTQTMAAAWTGMAKGYKLFMNNRLSAEQAAALMQKISQRELQKIMMEQ